MATEITTPTKLIYMTDSYIQAMPATVVAVIHDGEPKVDGTRSVSVILDQTLFYAQGGGQPADQGEISGPHGKVAVSHVSYNGGAILHKGSLEGQVAVGEKVSLHIHWPLRYKHMQLHTAGHIVDQAVKNILPGSKSIDGNHGIGKKLSITFSTAIPETALPAIQKEVNKIITEAGPITFEMLTKDEIISRSIAIPFDLPSNKPLRILQLHHYPPMPDGGTHLHTTDESWPITITGVKTDAGNTLILYQVQEPIPSSSTVAAARLSLVELKKKVAEILAAAHQDLATPEELKTTYLGKKGRFNDLAQMLRQLTPQDRKAAGMILNELKTQLEQLITERANKASDISGKWVDLSAPGQLPRLGHMHPVSQAMEQITQIFEHIGFTRVRYPEVDWDHYVFEALNMPSNHPARDEWETFFIDAPIDKKFGKVVLTAHTSNGQVREMERLNSTPPIRMINIARCYRRQQDATHTQMFHQFEGLVVDKGITIQHLKGTLDYFAQEFYGPGTKSRIRPFHFQFTEPSFEVDFSCHICKGTGQVDGKDEEGKPAKVKCKFCKSGWHEVGGAGMVHPNVLKAGGIDANQYTGFAFGWGIERTYTLKPGLNIDDIRLLYSGEMKFLEQF